MIQNIDAHRDDAKWLMSTLEELTPLTDQDTADLEKATLDADLDRYQNLMPAVEVTTTKSSVVVRCYEYREVVERSKKWLKDTESQIKDDIHLDDLQSVRIMVEEHEVSKT